MVTHSGPIAVQFDVQVDELSEEAAVRDDPSPFFNRVDGLHQGHVVLQHQVRQDDGGRAAHAHVAVHQDLTCIKVKRSQYTSLSVNMRDYGKKSVAFKMFVTFYPPS